MVGDEITKILDIRVKYDNAITELGTYKTTLDQIKEAEKQLKQELKEGVISQQAYGKQMSALEQNSKRVKSATRDVTREVQNNIKVEKEAQGSLTQMRAKLSNLTATYDKLSKVQREGMQGSRLKVQINDLTKSIKEAETATQRFYRNVGNYKSALVGLQQLGSAFKTFGGVVAGVLGGIGIDQVANHMLEVARNFEDAMARVRSVANPTSGEFTMLQDKAKELGMTTKYTATEVANGMEELARKGFDAKETVETINPVLKLAQANVVSMADAAQVASSSLRAFNMEASDMEQVTDVLSSACSHSATNLTQLGEAMKTAGPTAHAANISLETTTALIGSLANVGMTGSDAGTGVKQVIMALATAANGTEKARKVLEHYNLDITEARLRSGELLEVLKEMKQSGIGNSIADLKQLTGKYASPRLANIINNIDEAIKLNDTLENSIGENDRMFDQSIGKTSNQIYLLKSAWENVLIGMYDSTSEYLVTPLKWLTETIKFLGSQINFLGQTFTSVLVGLAALPAWKGLQTFGGVIAATWEEARVKAGASIEGLKNEVTVATENLTVENGRMTAAVTKQVELQAASLKAIDAEVTANAKLEEAEREGLSAKEIAKRQELVIKAAETTEQCEKAITANLEAQSKIRADIVAAELKVRQTKEALAAAESKALASTEMNVFQSTWVSFKSAGASALAFITTGIKGLFSLFKTFLPFAIIFGVVDFIQGLNRIQDELSQISDAEGKVNEKVGNVLGEDKKIAKLRMMRDIVVQIREENRKNGKINEASQKQIDGINKRLHTSHTSYTAIIRDLDKMIAKQQKISTANALNGIMTDSQLTLQKLAIKYGVQATDPDKIVIEMGKIFDKQPGYEKVWQVATHLFGVDNMYGDNLQAMAAYKQYRIAMQKYLELGVTEGDTATTNDPGYNPSNVKGKKEPDYRKQLLNYLNKLIDQTKAAEVATNNDGLQKALAKANEEMNKVLRDLETQLGPEGHPEKGALAKALAHEPDLAQKIFSARDNLEEALKVKNENDKIIIRYDWDTKNTEREKDVLSQELNNIPDSIKDYYIQAQKIQEKELEINIKGVVKSFFKGEYGRTAIQGTYDEILDGYEEYEKKREGLMKEYSGDEQKTAINRLNNEYTAEAEMYNRVELLSQSHTQKMLEINRRWMEEEHKQQSQRLQNSLDLYQTMIDDLTNLRRDSNNIEGFGSDEYWTKLKNRIGEEQGTILQMQYQQAQEELAFTKEHNARMVREGQMTKEEEIASNQEAERKIVSIHTEANNQIDDSDKAHWEAYSSLMGGAQTLMESFAEQDKSLAKLAKTLALAKIAIDTGAAISNVVKEASSKGWPAMLPIIAGGVATVMGNIASAISTVRSAKFARGGVNIGGAGTETSDSISANLSRGESVINAKATKMFEPILIAMNNIGNGVSLPRNNYVQTQQTADISEAFSMAVANVRPVVDVREITHQQKRVEVIQNLDSI